MVDRQLLMPQLIEGVIGVAMPKFGAVCGTNWGQDEFVHVARTQVATAQREAEAVFREGEFAHVERLGIDLRTAVL